jgi:dihydrofolate reductase
MKISIIVAVGPKREIGHLGKMSWDYPTEYAHFLKTVSGHCILMGRVNFEENISNSLLLSRTTSLVISNQEEVQKFLPSQVDFDMKFFSKIEHAVTYATQLGEKELFIIGGEKIYRETLTMVDKIYYSIVPYEGPSDRFFPEIPKDQFKLVHEQKIAANGKSPAWTLLIYERLVC